MPEKEEEEDEKKKKHGKKRRKDLQDEEYTELRAEKHEKKTKDEKKTKLRAEKDEKKKIPMKRVRKEEKQIDDTAAVPKNATICICLPRSAARTIMAKPVQSPSPMSSCEPTSPVCDDAKTELW